MHAWGFVRTNPVALEEFNREYKKICIQFSTSAAKLRAIVQTTPEVRCQFENEVSALQERFESLSERLLLYVAESCDPARMRVWRPRILGAYDEDIISPPPSPRPPMLRAIRSPKKLQVEHIVQHQPVSSVFDDETFGGVMSTKNSTAGNSLLMPFAGPFST